ncbi:MAG: flagellar hook assembly protein FlgD [Deltaproteobacteria bacterium]|nr:flagellar hook assembly protein FlgD [Deltaproteobacteria bacterium]
MSIVGIDSILANQTPVISEQETTGADELGKDQFFKLLVTQLQYQDPLNPVENTEFTAQLAQFTSLELLDNMSTNMEQLGQLQGSINNIQALTFLGKQVSASGNIVDYAGDEVGIDFELEGDASEVAVHIFTDSGSLVKTIDVGTTAQGDVRCTWDGTDSSNHPVASGRYTYKVEAVDQEGYNVGATTYATGTVTGVRYDNGITYLIIGDKEVTISEVDKIIG